MEWSTSPTRYHPLWRKLLLIPNFQTIEQWIRENKKDRMKKAPSEKDIIFIWTIAISIFSIGGMLGSLMTAYFANRFGHKGGLVWNNCIMFLAAIFLFFAKAAKLYEVFIFGRLLIGINAGLNSGLCPMYLAEIAPVRLRGSTTALYSFVVSVSLFVSQFFSLEATLGDAENWPTIFAIAVIPSLLQLVALWICPESPRFLFLTVDDEVKGQKALVWLRNKADIRAEVSSLIEHKTVLQQLPTASFKAMFKHSVYRTPLIICLTMVLSQQCCGIEAVSTYKYW
jgi:SP family facilitated glucose transporter-like MFS transporter 1